MARCNILKENGDNCNSKHGINRIIFFDPETSELKVQTACQDHSDIILNRWLLTENRLKIIQEKLENEIKRSTTEAQNYKISWQKEKHEKLKELRAEIKRIRWDVCRNPLCYNNKLNKGEAIFSAIVFSQYGRLRHIFHFHRKCSRIILGQCNLISVVINRSLDHF